MAKLCFPSVPNTLGSNCHAIFSLIYQGKERHFFIHIFSSFIADYIKGLNLHLLSKVGVNTESVLGPGEQRRRVMAILLQGLTEQWRSAHWQWL